jgi:hypothetical protein
MVSLPNHKLRVPSQVGGEGGEIVIFPSSFILLPSSFLIAR